MLERLEKSVKRLSQFTADASHELRSPLAVIRTTAEVALRRDRPSPDYRSALEQIHSYAVRLSSLVEDLLALARTEEAKDAASAVVDLRTAVHSAQQLLSPMAEMKEIHLALEAALNGYEPKVRGDQESIERLFTILLDNAIKYTPAHGSVSVRMWNADDTRVAVDVCDSGPGIAPEHVPHIFERFYRIDRVRTPGAGGVGLGLALAKSIAVAHGAELQVESEIDRGSTFRILFRREPVTRSGE
jgi:signal transduction histidine kinase